MLAFDGAATLVGLFKAGETIELMGSDFLRERKIQGVLARVQSFPCRYAKDRRALYAGPDGS